MLAFGIFLCVFAVTALTIIGLKDDDAGILPCFGCALLLSLGVVLIVASIDSKRNKDISTKYNSVSYRIEVVVVNGAEVSRDTVYTFTPKKK